MSIRITAVVPVYNELNFLPALFDFFSKKMDEVDEIIFCDGRSTDGTSNLLKEYAIEHPKVQVLDNPHMTVPFALNLAIKQSTGNIIVRMDVHCEYSDDYFQTIIDALNQSGADIVGGSFRIDPRTVGFGKMAGKVVTSAFGSGGNHLYKTEFNGFTDHVTFGAWKRNIFDVTGYFDTHLKRNQDDEFHYRASKCGFSIYQSSQIKLRYHPRSNLMSFSKQYFQYGLYKLYALKKNPELMKIRHLIPSAFVLLILGTLFFPNPVFYLFCSLYFIFTLVSAFKLKDSLKEFVSYPILFFVMHISYGIGFILGVEKAIRLKPLPEAIPRGTKQGTPAVG